MQEARKKDGRDLSSRWLFWGLEEYFSRIPGIEQTTVGYANGQVETTNYQLIKETDHAETVQVVYDPDKITLRAILLYFFRVIDPLSINKQGNDRGRQYRTGVYYLDEADRQVIAQVFAEQEEQLGRKIAGGVRALASLHPWLRTTTKTTSRRILGLLPYRCDGCSPTLD